MNIRRTREETGLSQMEFLKGYDGAIGEAELSQIENHVVEAPELFLRFIFHKYGFIYTDDGRKVERGVATPEHAKLREIMYQHIGEKNAIGRDMLKTLLGVSDRKTRQLIEDLQINGVEIVNLSNGEGYFIGRSGDIEKYKRQERNRIESVMMKTLLWGV